MSHTSNIKMEFRDKAALEAACKRLGIKIEHGTHKLYASTEKGIGVYLKDWRYPAVIRQDGTVAYDNYNGAWGNLKKLEELRAYYGLEKARIEAQIKGYTCYETSKNNMPQLEILVN